MKAKWQAIKKKLESGKFKHVDFDVAGTLCYSGQALPKSLHDLLPAAILEKAAAFAKERRAKREKVTREVAERLRREHEELEARLDEPGFVLLAGEETEMVQAGTLRECRDNLWKITARNLPRDRYSGKGCWLIVKNDYQPMSGYFDRDMYW